MTTEAVSRQRRYVETLGLNTAEAVSWARTVDGYSRHWPRHSITLSHWELQQPTAHLPLVGSACEPLLLRQ